MKSFFKASFLFFVLTLAAAASAEAGKFLGLGSKDYDIAFIGLPVSVRTLGIQDTADAYEKSEDGTDPLHLVTFKIERVLVGEFKKMRRGGPSRYDQMTEAMKNKEVLDVVGFNFKNPEDEIERDTLRIAVQDAGSTFGLLPGEPLAYFQHKIYLKRLSKKSETFLFLKSEPLNQAA